LFLRVAGEWLAHRGHSGTLRALVSATPWQGGGWSQGPYLRTPAALARIAAALIQRLLNHSPTSVTAKHYALYEYEAEKAQPVS